MTEDEEIFLIFSHHATTPEMGYIWSRNQTTNAFKFVDAIRQPVDLTEFQQARVVSSMLTVFSDTISTTTATLSGRLTGV